MSFMRNLVFALPVVLLAGCGLFGGKKVELSEEEKAARIIVNPFSENLTPDPALAGTTITLPAATPATDWAQVGVNASKIPGHVAAGEAFRIGWRASVGGTTQNKRLVAAPVAKDGRIYVIDSDQKVSAFSTDNGNRIWERQLDAVNPKNDKHAVGVASPSQATG
jgi:outer membrane protein assembly factor BamB